MSINDILDYILNDDFFIPLLVIFFIILIPITYMGSKKLRYEVYNNDQSSPIETKRNVKVVSKYSAKTSANQFLIVKHIIFELEDKTRLDLPIEYDLDFNGILENDKGTLTHKGQNFIDFERDL